MVIPIKTVHVEINRGSNKTTSHHVMILVDHKAGDIKVNAKFVVFTVTVHDDARSSKHRAMGIHPPVVAIPREGSQHSSVTTVTSTFVANATGLATVIHVASYV
ncbi:unnamed protein product [Arabidopsis halleri]